MSTARKLEIKNHLINNKPVLGNNKTKLAHLASDLVNSLGKGKNVNRNICDATYLSPATIDRIRTLKESESGRPYLPAADTLERIFIYFGVEFTANQIAIKSRYLNKPKDWI